MNAASRILAGSNVFHGQLKEITISNRFIGYSILLVCFMLSALAVVYVKGLERQYAIELHSLQQRSAQLEIENKRLLLEQSTWAAPARLEQIARKQLNMTLPQTNEIVILRHREQFETR